MMMMMMMMVMIINIIAISIILIIIALIIIVFIITVLRNACGFLFAHGPQAQPRRRLGADAFASNAALSACGASGRWEWAPGCGFRI